MSTVYRSYSSVGSEHSTGGRHITQISGRQLKVMKHRNQKLPIWYYKDQQQLRKNWVSSDLKNLKLELYKLVKTFKRR